MSPRVTDGPERLLLEDMLDRNRVALIETVRGLSESEARRRLVPSATTPIGLLKHAAAAERFYFQRFLLDLDEAECDGYASPGDGSFAVGDDESVADVIAEFERASERSRAIVEGFALDHSKHHSRGGAVSVRWLLLHLIEEFARHAGHSDIVREQIEAARRAEVASLE